MTTADGIDSLEKTGGDIDESPCSASSGARLGGQSLAGAVAQHERAAPLSRARSDRTVCPRERWSHVGPSRIVSSEATERSHQRATLEGRGDPGGCCTSAAGTQQPR